ncbi:hypothetical protein GF406_14185 [candidate division KSB1 bacterium]|nr:hypothetical protein [candidate division KSB1 bacterium]
MNYTAKFFSESSLGHLVSGKAQKWGISPNKLLLLWMLPFFIIGFGLVLGAMGKEYYKWYTGEDGFVEILQVILYFVALYLVLKILIHLYRTGNRLAKLFFALFAAGLIFMIGEELSWGQRIFGWASGEFFVQHNKQKETNLHNMFGLGELFKWVQLMAGAWGGILPFFNGVMKNCQPDINYLYPILRWFHFFCLYLYGVSTEIFSRIPADTSFSLQNSMRCLN